MGLCVKKSGNAFYPKASRLCTSVNIKSAKAIRNSDHFNSCLDLEVRAGNSACS